MRLFYADLAFGKRAEADPAVRDLLAALYPDGEVRPAPPDLDAVGIDLVVDRRPFPVGVQVKAYRGTLHPLKTAKVFLEDFSDVGRGMPGWLWTSRAELLVVRYEDQPVVLHFPTLRVIAEREREDWGHYYRHQESRTGNARWTSTYWAVPLAEVAGAILDPWGALPPL